MSVLEIDDENQIRNNIALALQDELDYASRNNQSSLDRLFGDDVEEEDEEEENDEIIHCYSTTKTTTLEDQSSMNREKRHHHNDMNFLETNIIIRHDHFSLLQSDTAFDQCGDDTTGSVLWGASICLGHYFLATPDLFSSMPMHQSSSSLRVVELGCGSCAFPSIAIAKRWSNDNKSNDNNTIQIIPTDFHIPSLQRAQANIHRNNGTTTTNVSDVNMTSVTPSCSIPHIEVQYYDWYQTERHNKEHSFDMIVAADVIYGVSSVPTLVRTIHRLSTNRDGGGGCRLYMATRDGRRGIPEFRYYIKQYITGLCEIDTITYTSAQLKELGCHITTQPMQRRYEDDHDSPNSAPQTNELWTSSSTRWNDGSYTIYIYEIRHEAIGGT